ncbi:MAG: hypothetical protein ABEJ76_08105 [Halanaeroarchaeum sp.]
MKWWRLVGHRRSEALEIVRQRLEHVVDGAIPTVEPSPTTPPALSSSTRPGTVAAVRLPAVTTPSRALSLMDVRRGTVR